MLFRSPPDAGEYAFATQELSVGAVAACSLEPSGAVHCWHNGHHPEMVPAKGTILASVSVGQTHVCGLDPSGRAECWGGIFEQASVVEPQGVELQAIDCYDSTCGVDLDGEVRCWGEPGSEEDWIEPNSPPYVNLSISLEMVCTLKATGSVECWKPA